MKPRIENFDDMEEVKNPDGSFRGYKSINFDNAMADYNREERKRFIHMLLGELDGSPMVDPQIGDMSEDVSIVIYRILKLKKFEVDQLMAYFALRHLGKTPRNQAIKKVLEDEERGVN
jgi:hypothetical protein